MKTFILSLVVVFGLQYYTTGQSCTATITAGGPTTFCQGGSVVLSANTSGNGTWTQKANFVSGRYAASGFSIGSKGYIGMGFDGNIKNDFWEYDPITNTWTQKANFAGSARFGATGFNIGNKGYIGTGNDGLGTLPYKNDFWEYDPNLNVWTQRANFGGNSRYNSTGFSIGNKGYLGLGEYQYSLYNDFWEYDPATDNWTQKANFGGTARTLAAGLSVGNKGYIGTGKEEFTSNFKDDFWEYDPSTDNWTQKANFGGTARAYAAGLTFGNKGYIGTGFDINYARVNDFWEYDPTANTWTQKANFGGTVRNFAVGLSVGNKGYIGTGMSIGGNLENDFWEYDPGFTYLWSSGETTPTITVTTSGSYTVTATDGTGCSATSSVTIVTVVNNVGILSATASTNPICVGSTTNLTANGVTGTNAMLTWWTGTGGTGTNLGTGTTLSNQGAGTYYARVTGDCGTAEAMVTVAISAISTPIITAGGPTTFCQGGNVLLSANSGNPWTQKANFGGGVRVVAPGFSIGGKGYMGTGQDNTGPWKNDFWEFNPATNTWTQKANFGGAIRVGAAGFSIGNKGYIGIGANLTAPTIFYKDFWEYDPVANTWTKKADFGGSARYVGVGFSIGSKGYIGTGQEQNGTNKNDFWEYDPATDTWIQMADFGGTARFLATGFSAGNKGYIGTGAESASPGTFKKDFWEYDPAANTWTQKANFGGTARYFAAGLSVGNKGYIGTGIDLNNVRQNDFWEYDPLVNTWKNKENFGGGARYAATGFNIGDKGYLGIGNDYSAKRNDFWEFNPNNSYSYNWSNGATTAGNTVNSSGSYTVTVTNYAGCSATSSPTVVTVIASAGIVSATAVVNPICEGTTTNLTANGVTGSNAVVTWWSGPGGTGTNLGSGNNLSNQGAGTYYARVTADCGVAEARIIIVVAAISTPIITAGGPTTFCDGGNVLLSANTGGNTWTQKANFGGGVRTSALAFSIGYKAYMGTGYDNSGPFRNDFWEYDPSSNTWTQKASFGGTARTGAIGFSIGNKGYIGTGFNGPTLFNDFWEYDPDLNSWTQKANFGGGLRLHAVGFSIGSKGYIGTGQDQNGINKNDFWEYNPASNNWTQKANFGGSVRLYATGFTIGSKGYIGTGAENFPNTSSFKNDFWEYDPAADNWTQKANFGGTKRINSTGFSVGNKGYIGTGIDVNNVRQNDFWEYDPSGNNWSQKANFGGGARYSATGFSIGSKGYIATGNDYSAKRNDAWEYDPSYAYSWSTGATAPSISAGTSGNFTVTATNGTGCIATSAPVTVTVKPIPAFTVQILNVNCNGGSDGSIIINATGGNGTYEYSIDNGINYVATNTFNLLPAAIYGVLVKSDHCVSALQNVTITTIVDLTPPAINCPDDITINCDASANPANTGIATAFDNCDPAVVITYNDVSTQTPTGVSHYNYTITRTWKATDVAGNFSSCVQTITVQDVTPPVITCPAPITINCDASSAPANTGTATAADNCDPGALIAYSDASTQIPKGAFYYNYTITRTWTASDAAGNESTCTQLITVQDITPPVIICPVDITISCDASTDPASTGTATATDNCDPDIVITSSETSTYSADPSTVLHYNYVITRTWKAIDVAGNFSTCVQTITVQDITAPTIVCPAIVTVNCQDDNTSAATGVATATDNCANGNITITQSQTSTYSADAANALHYNYMITRTWKAIDVAGNFSTCVQTITVQDITAPTIVCPANVTVNCQDDNTSSATGVATATDNCANGNITITQTQTSTYSADPSNVLHYNYVITRTWKAMDVAGNFSTCVQTITVQDITAPTIVCPANVTVNCQDDNTSSATGVATATDNCANKNITITQTEASTYSADPSNLLHYNYVITRTWKATDVAGNFSTCVQTITVQDITAPTIVCPANITVNCQDDNTSAATGVATATDNCANGNITITQTETSTYSADPSNLLHYNYVITRTWKATDVAGNFSTCVQTINVQDVTPPVITCPAPTTINCDASSAPANTGTATAADNCDPGVLIDYSDASTQIPKGAFYYNYTITRTWTASDAAGNESTCTQLITVQDITPPVINCPVDITISCNASTDPASTGTATATDNCDPDIVITSSETSTYSADPSNVLHYNYVITRTWKATDVAGNFSTCVQTITVQDVTAPTIVCPANITVNCQDDNTSAATGVATATDNCANGNITITQTETSTYSADPSNVLHYNYVITRTWTAADIAGNETSCVQTITVQDVTAPTIVCPANVTVNCQDDNTSAATGVATATDICANENITITQSQTSTYNADPSNLLHYNYVITRTWKATDVAGNFSTCVQTITVQDVTSPVISCAPGTPFTRSTNLGLCTYKVIGTEFNAVATDNCASPAITWSVTGATTISGSTTMAGENLNFGTNTITWTAKDVSNNTTSCIIVVNVSKATTTTTVTATPGTQQYSDKITLSANVTNCGGAATGGIVTFKIGTQTMGTAIVQANGTATLSNVALLEPTPFGTLPKGQMAPGNKTVTANFAATANATASAGTTSITITKENADVTYTGMPYFSTENATSCAATVTLSATVKDITALGGPDTAPGDIRNATVTFRLGNPVTGIIVGTPNIPVVLAVSGNTMVGTVSTTFTYTLSPTDCANKGTTLDVYAIVNNYYTGNNYLDPGNVTISVPGSEAVTGGGYLIMQSSIGTYAGTGGTKTNFGFTMKYTKSGSKAKGQCNIIVRRNGRVYQIKSNAINSLSVNGRYGSFNTKANMKDITDPLNPISVYGNADLFVTMYDSTNGGQWDEVSILYQSGSTIIYSSHWNGTQTIRRVLNGGNIQVRTGMLPTGRIPEITLSAPVSLAGERFDVKVLGNPTSTSFKLKLESNDLNEEFTVKVLNVNGRLVEVKQDLHAGQVIEIGKQFRTGIYFAEVTQGVNRKVVKLVKIN